ncbi:hypothetical protein EMCRGX_G034342, partial [Ephydatia muelleri]
MTLCVPQHLETTSLMRVYQWYVQRWITQVYLSLHVCGCLYGVGGCMRVCECVLPSIHHSQFLIASYCWNARAPVTPRWEETLVLDVHIYDIPHHLVMLPPMMNMKFYDIDIVMAMQLPHYRLHKTFMLTYKSTKTRFSIPPPTPPTPPPPLPPPLP